MARSSAENFVLGFSASGLDLNMGGGGWEVESHISHSFTPSMLTLHLKTFVRRPGSCSDFLELGYTQSKYIPTLHWQNKSETLLSVDSLNHQL